MDNIFCLKLVGFPIHGLSNQLFSLTSSIINAHKNKQNIVIVDNFLTEIWSYNYVPISTVVDLHTTNIFLKKYNVSLIDSEKINFKIVKILFGVPNKLTDITSSIMNTCFKDNILTITKNTDILKIKGDPCEGIEKKIFVHYQLSGQNFCNTYDEKNGCLLNDVVMNFNDLTYHTACDWKNEENELQFNDIIKNLVFHQNHLLEANKFIQTLDSSRKINVIHLRVESDAIQWWAHQNNIASENFQAIIESKYMHLIKKYINIHDNNIILCSDENNKVIEFLKNNNYKYFIHKKHKSLGREINALIDLCIGENCNNIYLAPTKGSSFSYTLKNRIKNPINTISFSLNHIYEKTEIEIAMEEECTYTKNDIPETENELTLIIDERNTTIPTNESNLTYESYPTYETEITNGINPISIENKII